MNLHGGDLYFFWGAGCEMPAYNRDGGTAELERW